MKLTGTLIGASTDLQGNMSVNLRVNEKEVFVAGIEDIKECLLDIDVKKHRNKRSLDANALLWVCLDKIAKTINQDKWNAYLLMLKRYGKFTYVQVLAETVEDLKRAWRECEVVGNREIDGRTYATVLCYFGSSTYNTKEFSELLNGVVSEMEMMGIETPTSKEMQRSLELWEKSIASKKEQGSKDN